ncbi:hypothetical protein [Olsenella massiliensis]|uniref:hypothetical protein n=1 Tax=Olsenella massiliensis TaxID=1622075 RepID=UPI00071CFF3D|nr:hypothetical protein [Olsenella massiliensis]
MGILSSQATPGDYTAEVFKPIDSRDMYIWDVNDVMADGKPIKSVRNRPWSFFILGALAIGFFIWTGPGFIVVNLILLALLIVLTFVTSNDPVMTLYPDVIICHKWKNPSSICVIPRDKVAYWNSPIGRAAGIQIVFSDPMDEKKNVSITIKTMNSFGVVQLLDKYFYDKSLSRMQLEHTAASTKGKLGRKLRENNRFGRSAE